MQRQRTCRKFRQQALPARLLQSSSKASLGAIEALQYLPMDPGTLTRDVVQAFAKSDTCENLSSLNLQIHMHQGASP